MKHWKIQESVFIEAVKTNTSISGIIRTLGMKPNGATHRMVKIRTKLLDLNTNHWLGQASNKGKKFPNSKKTQPLSDILIENSDYLDNPRLRKRLISANLLKEICECGLGPLWNNKKLVLQLDHINGIPNDNRIENLRLLCPNCHTQTSTWGAQKSKSLNYCKCGKQIQRRSKSCGRCLINI